MFALKTSESMKNRREYTCRPVEYMRKPWMASAAVHSFPITIFIVCPLLCVRWHCIRVLVKWCYSVCHF